MTLIPMVKKCSRCKKKYIWNPDVGRMFCPRCGIISAPGFGDIPNFSNKKDNCKE